MCTSFCFPFKGAQIIVFPEYGIYGLGWLRQTIAPYLEYIPNPGDMPWNPCLNPSIHDNTDVQSALSCMARNQGIFVVASMGATQSCLDSDVHCPDGGKYQYSASVIYDSNGTFIGRYFKQHLYQYETFYFDTPKSVDYTVFNTTFGCFGTFSSNDIMFHDPAITLIEKMKIDNIVYPTAWKDELPLMAAIEFHSAFSMGMGIKFLVANLHRPGDGYHGSGMYWPMGTSNDGVYYYNDSIASSGQLLVYEVGSRSQVKRSIRNSNIQRLRPLLQSKLSEDDRIPVLKNVSFVSFKPSTIDSELETFTAKVNHDTYSFIPIRSSYGDKQVCQGRLCCSTGFEGTGFENTLYALGAFDGMHTYGGKYYLQGCIFIQCANSSITSCGLPVKNSKSYMDKMSFSGNFTTKYVFPEVLVTYDNSIEIVTRTWLYQESIIIDVGVPGAPLSISMYARDYSRDPAKLSKTVSRRANNVISKSKTFY